MFLTKRRLNLNSYDFPHESLSRRKQADNSEENAEFGLSQPAASAPSGSVHLT